MKKVLAFSFALLLCSNVFSQTVPIKPQVIVVDSLKIETTIDELSYYYHTYEWEKLNSISTEIIYKITEKHGPENYVDSYFNIIFVDSSNFVVDYFYHKKHREYSRVIPKNLKGDFIYQVILSSTSNDSLGSLCTYKDKADPLTDLFPTFLKSVASSSIGIADVVMPNRKSIKILDTPKSKSDLSPPPSSTIYYSVSEIKVPKKRSEVESVLSYKKGSKEIKHKSTFINSPNSLISFEILTGYALSIDNYSKYSVVEDTIRESSVGRAISLATVSINVPKYNSELSNNSLIKGVKIFGGIGVAPEPSLALGLGLRIPWGISLNAGTSYLFVNGLKAGENSGAAKITYNPFKTVVRRSKFVGISFKFSK